MYRQNAPYTVAGVKSKLRNRQYTRIPAEVRFMTKVERQPDGCWNWTAATLSTRKLAAKFGFKSKNTISFIRRGLTFANAA